MLFLPLFVSPYDDQCVDFLNAQQVESLAVVDAFDVCFDKGTYDALRLNPDACPEATAATYAAHVKRLLKQPEGRLVLTSCNWTEEELVAHFERGCTSFLFEEFPDGRS